VNIFTWILWCRA